MNPDLEAERDAIPREVDVDDVHHGYDGEAVRRNTACTVGLSWQQCGVRQPRCDQVELVGRFTDFLPERRAYGVCGTQNMQTYKHKNGHRVDLHGVQVGERIEAVKEALQDGDHLRRRAVLVIDEVREPWCASTSPLVCV